MDNEDLRWQCCTCGYPTTEKEVKYIPSGDMYCDECYQEWLEDNPADEEVSVMTENEKLKSLMGECLAYRKYGQEVNPVRVEEMLKEAFTAGKETRV